MRLLIITQAVDLDDPILGFFHRWIEEFSKHCKHVHVICLKERQHRLPPNVSVYSLGKGKTASGFQLPAGRRLRYAIRFFTLLWRLRNSYDAVFVHMNQEYVLLGGKFWWLMGRRVILWRNHKKGSIWTRIAALLSYAVCYTSPEAYVTRCKNSLRMPVGIDTNIFTPSAKTADKNSILFLGRLDPVKRPEIFVSALKTLATEGVSFHADIYGDPTPGNEAYARDVRTTATSPALHGHVRMHPGVTHDKTPVLYSSHSIYVNLTPSGSFDKTIGEAMASGCVVIASNEAVREVLGDTFMARDAESTVRALAAALEMPEEKRMETEKRNRAYIEREHSLPLLVSRLWELLAR